MATASSSARPLAGRRIAVTRALHQAAALLAALRAAGAEPLAYPAIAIEPPRSTAPLDAALAQLASSDWVIMTSVNTITAVAARLTALGLATTAITERRLAAVGPATAAAMTRYWRAPDLVPPDHQASGLLAALGPIAGLHCLLPQGDLASPTLSEGLRARGARVTVVTAYRTVPGAGLPALVQAVATGGIDALCLTSPSTLEYSLMALAQAKLTPGQLISQGRWPRLVAIGPVTARAVAAAGLSVAAVASDHSPAGLIVALTHALSAHSTAKE